MSTQQLRADERTLTDFIKDIRVAMMTTMGADGMPHTRPMYTYPPEPSEPDTLWFTTDVQSHKVQELRERPMVHLTYSDTAGNNYVAVTGEGELVNDRARLREMWNIHTKAWFPGGPDDPNLGLLRVRIKRAEYWDGPSRPAYLLSVAKAVLSGGQPEGGEHRVVR